MRKCNNPANPLPRDLVKELTEISTLKGITYILLDYIMIAAIIIVAISIEHPIAYILAIPLIGNRQHSLLIQMHDAAHGNISKNKKINDFVGELLTAWPMLIKMQSYRLVHNKHHSFSNTDKDPDFIEERFPQSREVFYKMLLKDLFGLGIFNQIKKMKRLKTESSTQFKLARILFFSILLGTVTAFSVWKEFIIFWIIPLFTWLSFILQIRSVADHSGPDLQLKEHPFNTRTVIPNLFDRLFIAPRNCSYHLAHSVYAKVPTYNLKRCHEELMKYEIFKNEARITNGYINLFKEFPKYERDVKERDFDFYKNEVTV